MLKISKLKPYTECLKYKETRIEVAPYASFRYTKISLLESFG